MRAATPLLRSFAKSQPARSLLRSSPTRFVTRSTSAPLQRRCASRYVKTTPLSRLRQHFEDAKRDYPIQLPVLSIFCVVMLSLVGIALYDDYTRIAPQFEAFPLPVEQRLRLALHYTHIDSNPDAAAKHFAEAIKAAEDCGMNPFSKESMGIRIRYSQMLEQYGYVKAAVDVLNEITSDCERKLAELDGPQPASQQPLPEEEGKGPPVTRKTLLRGIIETRTKVAALCESDYIQNSALAKQILSDAVGLLVKETKDPQKTGFNEDNAAGLSMAEIASILSQMGDLYATTGEEANAVQVYMLTLQPLLASCNGTRSCKEVQVLSNIASTMDLAMKKPNAKINGKPVTKDSLAAARRATLKWAEQAIATADLVLPESRDEICELGLLSAQMTRADLLLDIGDKQKAKESFISLLPTLRERGFNTLTNVAEQGLKRATS
jgi:hypothetical protein